jgi:hypothetical protein
MTPWARVLAPYLVFAAGACLGGALGIALASLKVVLH